MRRFRGGGDGVSGGAKMPTQSVQPSVKNLNHHAEDYGHENYSLCLKQQAENKQAFSPDCLLSADAADSQACGRVRPEILPDMERGFSLHFFYNVTLTVVSAVDTFAINMCYVE